MRQSSDPEDDYVVHQHNHCRHSQADTCKLSLLALKLSTAFIKHFNYKTQREAAARTEPRFIRNLLMTALWAKHQDLQEITSLISTSYAYDPMRFAAVTIYSVR